VTRRASIACALISALAAPLAGVAGCGGGSEKTGGARDVAAADFRFDPARIEVESGQTVRWTNSGQTAHNVKGPGFGTTSVLDPGQSYAHTFTRRGTFRYLCTLHPAQMRGTVVVR
jgi:plastocyanin